MRTFHAEGEPFSRRAAVDRAHHHITRLIDLKEYKPGDRLPRAAKLAEDIGVSRPVVLEALSILQSNGRISVGPGAAGSRVLGPHGPHEPARLAWLSENADTIRQMAVLREIVEPGIARLLAERGMPKPILRRAHVLLRRWDETPAEARQELLTLDTEFHGLLARATSMQKLQDISNTCRTWVAPAFDMVEWKGDRPTVVNVEHADIIRAIEARDADAAWTAARRHLQASTGPIEALMKRLGDDGKRRRRKR